MATDGVGTIHVHTLGTGGSQQLEFEKDGGRHWRRAVAWHPNSKWAAIGRDYGSELLLIYVERSCVAPQKRTLCRADRPSDKILRKRTDSYVGVNQVKFVNRGHKLAVWRTRYCSIGVYDISQQVK